MPSSPIRKLAPLADEARRRGIQVHHLNIGQPDLPTPPMLLDTFRKQELSVLAYGHSAGLPEYREALARYYRSHGIDVTSQEVMVTTGGSEAILFALLAVTDPGDEVVVPEPLDRKSVV